MDIRKLERIVVNALEDIKGKDIEVINTRKLTELFSRIVIASGDSNRQCKALAGNVEDKVREAGGEIIGVEGMDTGEWVLVDLGEIVVHVRKEEETEARVRLCFEVKDTGIGISPEAQTRLFLDRVIEAGRM